MKRYGLLVCFFGGNRCIGEVTAASQQQAIESLQPLCPVKLNSNGYAKQDETTYVIGEFYP